MRDISARELKGHNILAVERFEDSTRWMIEFVALHPCSAYGSRGDEMRLFLAEDSYQNALQDQQRRKIKIKRYAVLLRDTSSTLSRERNAQENIEKVERHNSLIWDCGFFVPKIRKE